MPRVARTHPAAAAQPVVRNRLQSALAARLTGPGGLYNLGNALGLVGGITLAVLAATEREPSVGTGLAAAVDYLAGSASALAVTAAMLIFFWSGEAYHRAWAQGFPPDARLNRRGDFLSGYGALMLGVGLFLIGEALLAATAGLLHAAGKFGSALHAAPPTASRWPDVCRKAVVVSRLPAIALCLAALAAAWHPASDTAPLQVAGPALLLVCYLIWTRADLMLLRT
jgi:hypothetical protein